MRNYKDPKEAILYYMKRSKCSVQTGAILVDYKDGGILRASGWNHEGDGFGEHAEVMCLKRANSNEIKHSAMYIAARRKKSGNTVTARPCAACAPLVKQCGAVVFRNKQGEWEVWS